MRVYGGWLKASMMAALAGLLLTGTVMAAAGGIFDINDISVSSIGPAQPTAQGPISLGVQDDGKTVTVNKGDTIRFTFAEYGAEDAWKMRNNPDVKVVSDLVMESYPGQHAITAIVLAPTDIYFDRASAPGGGKTKVAYHVTFSGNPVLSGGDMPAFNMPFAVTATDTGMAFSAPFKARGSIFSTMPVSLFSGNKISWDGLFKLK